MTTIEGHSEYANRRVFRKEKLVELVGEKVDVARWGRYAWWMHNIDPARPGALLHDRRSPHRTAHNVHIRCWPPYDDSDKNSDT